MIRFTNAALSSMQEELREIAITSGNVLQQAERSCTAIQQHITKLKEFIATYQFIDEEEEILFFKEIKPRFLKELVYYSEVYHLAAGLPPGDQDKQMKYYRNSMNSIGLFFERNQQLYLYYRIGKCHEDKKYFMRQEEPMSLNPEYLDLDSRFSTPYSCILSRIQAYEMLSSYINGEMENLGKKAGERPSQVKRMSAITWTDPKVYLIEVGYSVFASGAVNHGKADIKEIMEALQSAFNIDLGNYYAVFNQNIRVRKKNRTVYLDHSKDKVISYMDSLDEHPKNY